jgi:exosortase D (VPLPA-CTERM-specific)
MQPSYPGDNRQAWQHALWFASYLLLLAAMFHSAIAFMLHMWNNDDFTYCYLVPAIVAYLIWENKVRLRKAVTRPTWAGFGLILPGILFFWMGDLGGEYTLLYLSLWLIVVGLCLLHFGAEKLRVILFPILFSLTMFPLPAFINNRLSLNLKMISSFIGVEAMQWMGMSAYREGNVIDLGFTQLQVVDACNGLRYLLPLILMGLLVAYFSKLAMWQKIVLVLSSIPISILVNGLRIASVGLLYPIWGPQVAEGFFHDFSGWLIFMVSLGILLVELWLLKKIFPGAGDDSVAGRPGNGERAESKPKEEFGSQKPIAGEQGQAGGVKGLLPHAALALLLLAATAALSQGIEFREKIPINKALNQFPSQIGMWQARSQAMEQKIIDALDLDDYLMMDYRGDSGKNVNFYVAYYQTQRKGESIHSPASCMPGGGWKFKQSGKTTVTLSDNTSMPVNRAFMQKGESRQLSYYWFPMRGRVLTNAYEMKIYNFWDALTRQRTDGALVRLVTPLYGDESVESAEARLQDFMGDVVPVLDTFLPK